MKKYLLFFVMATGLYACSSVPITGRQQLNLVSDSEVLALSLQEYNNYIKTAKKSTDKTATAPVEKVGRKIADAVEAYFKATNQEQLIAGYQWEFNLVDDPQVNAFCMPGGKIVVYTGILPYAKDETGLAVVLGHEVGHAIAKHANERMSHQMAVQYGDAAVDVLLSKSSSTVQSIGSVVYGLGTEVGVMLPFNRKQELEADRLGLILMAIAGYDPNAAIPFWERMSQQGNKGSVEFLSTHPSDNTRIADIQKELPEAMEYYEAVYGKKPTTTTPAGNSNPNNNWHF
ncbi:MAG: M48 family metallopeptidase [Dysgonamonadaceae bacterium]|jgi:predicted Zn-dependent protease|nr:M48 family metallopeptidase [Dysgonamonadaceae bacterium]